MNSAEDLLFDHRVADWLEQDPQTAPSSALDVVLAAFPSIPQRRTWRASRRLADLEWFRLAAAAAAGLAIVAIVGFGVHFLLSQQPSIGTTSPSPATPAPVASSSPASPSGFMWPQSTLEEVRVAQERADAGDPDYTWQVSPDLSDPLHILEHHPGDAQIFPRFLEEVLGWEQFLDGHHVPRQDHVDLVEGDFVYIRCVPGGTNPLYPADPVGAGCAPTLDELRYETVKVTVAQLDRQGASGIWVVIGWVMIGPAVQVDPALVQAEAESQLEGFLQARVEGEGAEGHVMVTGPKGMIEQVPLLYAATNGAQYERFEIQRAGGPEWPYGHLEFDVRLFTDNDETVVEQRFELPRDETGRLQILYAVRDQAIATTTENGQAVPVSYRFLDGELTLRLPAPLGAFYDEYRDFIIVDGEGHQILLGLPDPTPFAPDCTEADAPTDAEALARIIGADPRFQATVPLGVTIGGTQALQMDVVLAPGVDYCSWSEDDNTVSGTFLKYARWELAHGLPRARLYLLDLPEGSKARVLALVTITDEDSFEAALEAAAPVIDSIEFRSLDDG